jgi:hypothetical protein
MTWLAPYAGSEARHNYAELVHQGVDRSVNIRRSGCVSVQIRGSAGSVAFSKRRSTLMNSRARLSAYQPLVWCQATLSTPRVRPDRAPSVARPCDLGSRLTPDPARNTLVLAADELGRRKSAGLFAAFVSRLIGVRRPRRVKCFEPSGV